MPPLGTASAFSVLAGTTVTNTGATTVDRSVGVHPGSAVTGRSTLVVGGTTHQADAVALQAKADLTTAYDNAAAQTPRVSQDAELGGETLVGGVYHRPAAMGLTGALTLDGAGDPGSVWVFQAGSTLTTAPGSSVELINGADPCHVFWQVGSSATLGTGTRFVGNILAEATITMNTGATIQGRTLARSGAVNLQSNVFTSPDCDYDRDVVDAEVPPDDTDQTDDSDDTGGTGGADTTGGTGSRGSGDGTGTGSPGGRQGGGGGGEEGGATETPGDSSTQVTTIPTGPVDTGLVGAEPQAHGGRAPAWTGATAVIALGAMLLFASHRRQLT